MIFIFDVNFFKNQSQVIKGHIPSVLRILNGFGQHSNQEQLRLGNILKANKVIKTIQTKIKIHTELAHFYHSSLRTESSQKYFDIIVKD